jgi:transcriptional regulator with XRE-family HTH domain
MAMATPANRVIQELGGIYRFNKVSQKLAAQLTGISTSAISRRLNGDVSPTLDDLYSLAKAAGVEVRIEFVKEDEVAA